MAQNEKIKNLEWKIENMQGNPSSNASFSPMKPKNVGYEHLIEFDNTEEEDDDVQSKHQPYLVATTNQKEVSSTLAHLIRTNFRRTQQCNDLSKTLHLAMEQILAGKTEDVGKTLGCSSKLDQNISYLLWFIF